MPIPTAITDLSTNPASNSPTGNENPIEGDNHLRTAYAFIRQIYDGSTGIAYPTLANLANTSNAALGPALVSFTALDYPVLTVGGALTAMTHEVLWDITSDAERAAILAGTSTTDHLSIIQAALNTHGRIKLCPGRWNLSAKLQWTADNQWIYGAGQFNTKLRYTGAGGAGVVGIIDSSTKGTTTRLWCGISDLYVDATVATVGILIDLDSVQHSRIQNVRFLGAGTNHVGINLGTTWTVTECTYNIISGCYGGGFGNCVVFGDGANSNIFLGNRWQPGFAGKYAYNLVGTATGRISNNVFLGGGVEFPGTVSNGFNISANCAGTTLVGQRFESLSTAINIASGATDTTLVGNYYSSNTTNVSDSGTRTSRLDAGFLKYNTDENTKIALGIGTSGGTVITKANGISGVVRNSTGNYTMSFTTAFPDANYVVNFVSTQPQHQVVSVSSNQVNITTRDGSGTLADCGYWSLECIYVR